jgi:hypothetical protein
MALNPSAAKVLGRTAIQMQKTQDEIEMTHNVWNTPPVRSSGIVG